MQIYLRWLAVFCALVFMGLPNKSHADDDYIIVYDNFSPEQVNQVLVYATRFSGYEQYEILSQRSSDTRLHYQSRIKGPLLSHNFTQTFEALQWEVIAQQQGNQYQFTFVREIPKPLPFGIW
ncbi:hypothetical protein ACFO4O_05550 [Glaciecola siphonariae]|uniref:Uncharacterized protein n=1 Tax=Glaciecola siphonariae TaxID=521012 RepID=A0ABV9LTX3_9ALTE